MLIGLDRANKRNAFDLPMLDDMCLAYGEFERDSEARVALIFAHGEHFTAGLDLANVAAQFAAGWQIPDGGCDPWGVFGGPRVSKPVIVAAHGYCYTIGIELMLASDINLCASNTRFAQMEVQRGIFPFGGATLRMHQTAGWGNAMRWLLTGDEFDAHEAYRLGLVQEVLASEELLPQGPVAGRTNCRPGTTGRAGHPGFGPPGGARRSGRRRCQPAPDHHPSDGQRRRPGRRQGHAGATPGRLQRSLTRPPGALLRTPGVPL